MAGFALRLKTPHRISRRPRSAWGSELGVGLGGVGLGGVGWGGEGVGFGGFGWAGVECGEMK